MYCKNHFFNHLFRKYVMYATLRETVSNNYFSCTEYYKNDLAYDPKGRKCGPQAN